MTDDLRSCPHCRGAGVVPHEEGYRVVNPWTPDAVRKMKKMWDAKKDGGDWKFTPGEVAEAQGRKYSACASLMQKSRDGKGIPGRLGIRFERRTFASPERREALARQDMLRKAKDLIGTSP